MSSSPWLATATDMNGLVPTGNTMSTYQSLMDNGSGNDMLKGCDLAIVVIRAYWTMVVEMTC